jgi:Tfp pilus assembly protein PilZ
LEEIMENFADRFAPDRRFARRFGVKTALRVRVWKSSSPEERAESMNVSERGIFFATNKPHQEGQVVEILLKMPEEVTGEPPTEWRCTGSVVRVQPLDSPKGRLGVGVRFDCYEVSRSEQNEPPVVGAFSCARLGV